MQKAQAPLSIEELKAKLLKRITETRNLPHISDLARELRTKEEQIEDAFYCLVRDGFLGRNFKHSGWSMAKHRSLRACEPRPVQPCLFPREKKGKDEQSTAHPHTSTALYDVQKKQVEVKTGEEYPGRVVESIRGELEVDGWKVREWRPKKRYVSKRFTEVPASIIITLVRPIIIWQEAEVQERGGGSAGGSA